MHGETAKNDTALFKTLFGPAVARPWKHIAKFGFLTEFYLRIQF